MNEDRSHNDHQPEVAVFLSQSYQEFNPFKTFDMVTGVQE